MLPSFCKQRRSSISLALSHSRVWPSPAHFSSRINAGFSSNPSRLADQIADNISLTNMTNKQYFQRLLGEKIISWGFPILLLLGVTSAVGSSKAIEEKGPGVLKALMRKEYLKIEKLNDKLDSYAHSFRKAEFGPVAAAYAGSLKSEKVSQVFGNHVFSHRNNSLFFLTCLILRPRQI